MPETKIRLAKSDSGQLEYMVTNIHVQHVRQNIITELIAGNFRQFIRNGILALASNQFRVLLRVHTGRREVLIRFHKESFARLIAGRRTLMISHDVELC